jgi:hypothetical protein
LKTSTPQLTVNRKKIQRQGHKLRFHSTGSQAGDCILLKAQAAGKLISLAEVAAMAATAGGIKL